MRLISASLLLPAAAAQADGAEVSQRVGQYADLQLRMSLMKTAKPRIPSPRTAGMVKQQERQSVTGSEAEHRQNVTRREKRLCAALLPLRREGVSESDCTPRSIRCRLLILTISLTTTSSLLPHITYRISRPFPSQIHTSETSIYLLSAFDSCSSFSHR